MTHATIFNAPPNAGKDHAAKFCKEYLDYGYAASTHQFKEKLFELVMAIYCVEEETFFSFYDDRILKETPMVLFGGLSPRQAMIKVSEEVIKPVYGKEYFGKAVAETVRNENCDFVFFSDGGFLDEIFPLLKVCDTVDIVRLTRPGCSFDGDSRTYINIEDVVEIDQICMYDIDNDGTAEDFDKKLVSYLEEVLQDYENVN